MLNLAPHSLDLLCSDAVPSFLGLFDPSIAPSFLYYAYLPIIFIVLAVTLGIFITKRGVPATRSFVAVGVIFSLLIGSELVLWIATPAYLIHFVWQIVAVWHVLLMYFLVRFSYLFIYEAPLPRGLEWALVAAAAPALLLVSSSFNLSAFNLTECESVTGVSWYWYYIYGLEAVSALLILFFSFKAGLDDISRKMRARTLGVGIALFWLVFIASYLVGDVTLVYEVNLLGPLGMVTLLGVLAYLVVRYQAFSIKTFSAQIFVLTLWLLTFSAFFVRTIENIRWIIAVNLFLTTVLGYALTRAVKREVAQREQIEDLAGRLKSVNSILSHDVKAVLGKNKDMFNALLTGDLNTEEAKPFLVTSFNDTNTLIRSIVTILESGHELILNPSSFNLKDAVEEVVTQLKKDADAKGISIHTTYSDGLTILADKVQLTTHVLTNLIANAINYTPKGEIYVSVERKTPATILFSVKDTGVGITDEDKNNLFKEGGHGKDSRKVNVHSTGYGLFIAKKIVDAHSGRIWAESEGQGKGSTFFVELPVVLPPQKKKA